MGMKRSMQAPMWAGEAWFKPLSTVLHGCGHQGDWAQGREKSLWEIMRSLENVSSGKPLQDVWVKVPGPWSLGEKWDLGMERWEHFPQREGSGGR